MIEIRRMAVDEMDLLHTLSNQHLVSEAVVVKLMRTGFQLDYRPLGASVWRSYFTQAEEGHSAQDFLDRQDRDVYFAWLEGRLVGQICLLKNWNNLAMVWDIRVDARARRRGVGFALMEMAEQWAWKKGLTGVMVETQDTNPGACQFYTHCGYRLAGVDTLLYAGLPQQKDAMATGTEAALFFYKLFNGK